MNKPVKFELAKLLKEKGFNNIDCNGYYHVCDGYIKGYAFCYSNVNNQSDSSILAPTIAEVVMWLYEKHGIWIEVRFLEVLKTFYFELTNVNNLKGITSKGENHFNSPTETYEAAIEYCLTKLI